MTLLIEDLRDINSRVSVKMMDRKERYTYNIVYNGLRFTINVYDCGLLIGCFASGDTFLTKQILNNVRSYAGLREQDIEISESALIALTTVGRIDDDT